MSFRVANGWRRLSQLCTRSSAFSRQQRRHLSLHEYHSLDLLKQAGVNIPKGEVAGTAKEAKKIAESLGGTGAVVKAQVLAGGRGKGAFDSGLDGGVKIIDSPQEVEEVASKMIGSKLITKQTGSQGRPCNKVLVCEKLAPLKEYYFAIIMDRAHKGPVIMASEQGGMNIEEVAKENPDAIIWQPIDIMEGLRADDAANVVKRLNFSPACQQMASEQMMKLYNVLINNDATMLEINPMTEDSNGQVYCMDVKINIDDNAGYRQTKLFELRDYSQEDPNEVDASKFNLNYIKLDGSIGCVVNGAGLAMATMDVIKLYNGEPANFLDIGGGATKSQVTKAFQIICSDSNVKVILVNIFGGIIRCDIIAQGIIEAITEIDTQIPVVVRLQGNNVDDAKELLATSNVNKRIVSEDNFGRAAKLAAKFANKQTLQQGSNFEIPL